MAPKRKKETKESVQTPDQKEKLEKSKGSAIDERAPSNPDVPLPWVNPLPLIKGNEVLSPLPQGEHQFISILNAEGKPSVFTRLQKIENVLDDPYRPPSVVEHYDGSSCDCYFRNELTRQQDLCENCEQIWRRWNWKWTPPPPIEIDPYQNFLCVGDVDPHFQPVRGDMVIFHPFGPQSVVGLRTEWGFILSYNGQTDLELRQHDLVIRLGSFSNSKDYIPYDRVEVRAMTKEKQWRFLGGQVALVREAPVKPPTPVQYIEPLEKKKDTKKKKDRKDKDSKKDGSQEAEGIEKTSDKKKDDKDKKKDKKRDKNSDGQANEVEIGVFPAFTMDGIPDLFNIIQKVPEAYVPHPGEAIFKPYHGSLTCNYKYNKPGMQCGMGEFLPQFGDILILEPQAWMHDEWGDKKKRPKLSMVKWYKPSPWRRELKQGMLLLRPHIDRYSRFLDTIPNSEYTPLMWSQWGFVELYMFEGRVTPMVGPIKMESVAPPETVAGKLDEKDKKGAKEAKIREKKVENAGKKQEKQEGKKIQKNTKDDTKASKANKRNAGEDKQNNLGENISETEIEPKDDMLWKYCGRSTHYFDEPFQFWALDKFCRKRHLREVQMVEHLNFFVEDTGVESDLEHAPKAEEVLPQEPKGKKAKGKGGKSKDKKNEHKEVNSTKKKI